MQGQVINGFVLKRLLGEGGMAEVWYAENEIGKPAAVKILFEKLTRNEQIVERFHNEALVMVKLNHSNIRQVYSYGYIGNRHGIVMEYLEGDDLESLLKKGHRFTNEELKRWWNQVVSALNYTHGQGIVHRDIKPSNLFLDREGNIKLLDFGIAKLMENTSLTQTGSMMGTLMYMSPEQVMDSKNIDYRTDIYSLAVSFVHLITGKKPYDSDTTSDFQIRERIVYTPYDVSSLPVEWQGFLIPYLEKDPTKRPVLRSFESVPLATPIVANPQGSAAETKTNVSQPPVADGRDHMAAPPQPQKPKRKKKIGLFIGLGIGSVILIAALAWLLFGRSNPDTEAYEQCFSISDYRSYMHNFGPEGRHYNEAKNIVDLYVADSISKAEAKERARLEAEAKQKEDECYNKCTTITACDDYLNEYPHGRYVTEVKSKKAELEEAERAKVAAEKAKKAAAAKKKAAEKKKQQNVKKIKITPKKIKRH